jgi:hypothetical protein
MGNLKYAAFAAVAGCALVPSGCIALFHLAEASPRSVSWLIVAALLLCFGLLCVIPGIRFLRGLRPPADVASHRARTLAARRATRPTATQSTAYVAGYLAIFALCGTVALDIATIMSGLAGDPMWLFLGVATISCAAMSRELVRASSRDLSSHGPSSAA